MIHLTARHLLPCSFFSGYCTFSEIFFQRYEIIQDERVAEDPAEPDLGPGPQRRLRFNRFLPCFTQQRNDFFGMTVFYFRHLTVDRSQFFLFRTTGENSVEIGGIDLNL